MEIWKNVKSYKGRYLISSNGRLRSIRGDKINLTKPTPDKDGYLSFGMRKIGVKRKWVRIHRLVAIHFIPNIENKPHVNHKDFDVLNNTVNNLEWVTSKENILHSHNNGRCNQKHECNNASKLTKKEVIAIRQIDFNEVTKKSTSKIYGVSHACISHIINGRSWNF